MPVHKSTIGAFQKGYKPTCLCTKPRPQGSENAAKTVKTHMPVHKKCAQTAREQEENFLSQAPARGSTFLSRASAQLRLARSHARTNRNRSRNRNPSPDMMQAS